MLGVASDRPAFLYGWRVGFGPWAHGLALALLGGPVIRALPNVILMAAVDVLAAQHVSMKPGLESVLESLAYFRSQRAGVVAPMVAFEDLSWLKWV